MLRIRAASVSGLVTIVSYWICVLFSQMVNTEYSSRTIVGIIVSVPILWVIGAITCYIFLLPLLPIYKFTPNSISLAVFLIAGILFPALLMVWANSIPVHGNAPVIANHNVWKAAEGTISMGFIGAATATASWIYLRRRINMIEPVAGGDATR